MLLKFQEMSGGMQNCGSFKVGGWELYSIFVEAE